jgi:protein-S-isoprenylcysteine O-methyltransferase Ste14
MDLLLFTLQVLFMGPIAYRLATRRTPPTPIGRELVASVRVPRVLWYEVGLLLVWSGFGLRFWTSGVERSLTWRGALGAALLAVATGLMFSSISVLRSWRVLSTIEDGHELCETGPYRLVRHPIYLAFDLLGIGLAIAVPTPVVIVGAALLIVGGELRARAEELAMIDAFGDRYREYSRRVAGRIPWVY